jgi:hypothetical protein
MGKDYNVVFSVISYRSVVCSIFYTFFGVVMSLLVHVVNRRKLQLIGQNLHFVAKTYMQKLCKSQLCQILYW